MEKLNEMLLSLFTYVWYVAYGSNLQRLRFEVYLRGGSPHGSTRVFPPNVGGTESPTDDVYFASERYEVVYGKKSKTWLWDPRDPESGGGMAFLARREGTSPKPSAAMFRAYRVRLEQFYGVMRAECTRREKMDAGGLEEVPEFETAKLIPWQDLPSLNDTNYPRLVCLGMLEDLPLLTFTCSQCPEPRPPTPEYARTILGGLLETHLRDEILRVCPLAHSAIPLQSRRVVVREYDWME